MLTQMGDRIEVANVKYMYYQCETPYTMCV